MSNDLIRAEQIENALSAVKLKIDKKIDKDGLEVGGRNLLLGSATKKITPFRGAQMSFEDNVSVDEWGATDAIRAYGTGGTDAVVGTIAGTVYQTTIPGCQYTHSIYIKNNSTKIIRVTNNIDKIQNVQPGEIARVVIHDIGNGTKNLLFTIRTPTAGDAFDFTYWRPQIEEGSVVTAWTPAPEDKANSSHTHDDRYYTETEVDAELSAKFGFIQEIGADVNLNDLTEEGYYHQKANANTSTANNYPAVKAGLLKVFNKESGNYIYQEYHAYDNSGLWHRTYYKAENVWRVWKKVACINDVLEKTNAVTASIPTTGWNSDSTTTYTKYYDITVSDVTEKDRADIIIAPGSIGVAEACGFCPTSETLGGKIRVRAQSIPTAAISAQYWIEKGK